MAKNGNAKNWNTTIDYEEPRKQNVKMAWTCGKNSGRQMVTCRVEMKRQTSNSDI